MKYILNPLKKINDINSKATVKEFFVFFFIALLLGIIVTILSRIFKLNYVSTIYRICYLIILIPLGFRRMNDAGLNKFLFLIPFINIFLALIPSKK